MASHEDGPKEGLGFHPVAWLFGQYLKHVVYDDPNARHQYAEMLDRAGDPDWATAQRQMGIEPGLYASLAEERQDNASGVPEPQPGANPQDSDS